MDMSVMLLRTYWGTHWELGNFMGTIQNHYKLVLAPQGIDYAIKFVIHFAT
jgi:hypothetical protein